MQAVWGNAEKQGYIVHCIIEMMQIDLETWRVAAGAIPCDMYYVSCDMHAVAP